MVSRLCASIQGTSPERLADCLGLDSSKVKTYWFVLILKHSESGDLFSLFLYLLSFCIGILQFQHKSSEALSGDPTSTLLFAADDEERYILILKFQSH